MKRTYGDSFIHVSQITTFVEASQPLAELVAPKITDLHRAIAHNVASLIEDGSVLQLGIGGIPDAVLPYLQDRKDLGVHSELISDNAIKLIDEGVINGLRKDRKSVV